MLFSTDGHAVTYDASMSPQHIFLKSALPIWLSIHLAETGSRDWWEEAEKSDTASEIYALSIQSTAGHEWSPS